MVYPADMLQDRDLSAHVSLVRRITEDLTPVIDAVARDVGEPPAEVEGVVGDYVAMLGAGETLAHDALAALRAVGAEAARDGVSLQVVLDRYLSTGWAVWAAAVGPGSGTADRDAVAALGSVLLRAGDAAAAAIAEGHELAERESAARDAAAYRGFVDELIGAAGGDPIAAARIARRGPRFGLDPRATYAVVAAHPGRDVEDEGREVSRVAEAALDPRSRPKHGGAIGAARGGRLVLVVPASVLRAERLAAALGEVAAGARWTAVRGPDAPRLADVGASAAEAVAALAIAERLADRAGRIIDARDVALERALLADEAALRAAVAWELGPIVSAPRIGGALVETLRAYLDNGQSVQATARATGIPARTVAYRLARIEQILDAPLDGPRGRRLAVALSGRDVLACVAPGP